MSNHKFKCLDCGEKYEHKMVSDNDVTLCKWCDTIELERQACEEEEEDGNTDG